MIQYLSSRQYTLEQKNHDWVVVQPEAAVGVAVWKQQQQHICGRAESVGGGGGEPRPSGDRRDGTRWWDEESAPQQQPGHRMGPHPFPVSDDVAESKRRGWNGRMEDG
uniref:Uncharacterized protein n=1 Tax=Globodera rostochiensis TaxID=31243 RepID=A0A914I5S1_GLORO